MSRFLSNVKRLVPSSVYLIVLGFILSPALLGSHVPQVFGWLKGGGFSWLSLLAQLGLSLFVLVVGMHFDKRAVWQNLGDPKFRTIAISSLLLPGLAGFVFGLLLFRSFPEYAARSGLWTFGVVNAIIFATAAVPVLCAILKSLDLLEHYRETVVIAMIGDVLLWNALGLLGAGTGMSVIKAALGLLIVIMVGFMVGTKLLEAFEDWVFALEVQGKITSASRHMLFILGGLATLGLSASSTQAVGAHILPGAFLAGLLLPDRMKAALLYGAEPRPDTKGHFQPNSVIERLANPLMVVFFLLPGLRFEGNLWEGSVWQLGALYSALATASKMTSVFFPALFVAQMSMKRAINMSLFLNTRGTMEIVAVSELYKLMLLSPEVFVAVIIMTLVCTALTVPGVYIVWWRYPEERSLGEAKPQQA